MGGIVCISWHVQYVVRYLERGHASNPIVQLYHRFVTYLGIDIVYRIEYGKKNHDIATFVESRL